MIEHGIKSKRSQHLIDFACSFAENAHEGQYRKYTDEPYIVHPVAVAKLVASVTDDVEMISAAFLHDVLEDTEVTYVELRDAGFGSSIANLVLELTDITTLKDGNRATRKALERERLANVSNNAKTIKLADLIDNTKSIIKYDKGFSQIFMDEMSDLVEVLVGGNSTLLITAHIIIEKYRR